MSTNFQDIKFEVKSISTTGFFSGYASVFNRKDNHNDIIVRGAFTDTIASKDLSKIKLLWQHKTDEPIGQIINIREDDYGLYIEGQLLLEITKGAEVYALMKQEIITGLSIGYTVTDFELDNMSGTRILKSLNLLEVSLVTFPAQEAAEVINVKSNLNCHSREGGNLPKNSREIPDQVRDDKSRMNIRDFEKFLRDAGFSRSEAKMISNNGFKSNSTQRDAEFIQLSGAVDTAMMALT